MHAENSPPPATREPPETPTRHELKCWPLYFQSVATGIKPFEVRKNDRDYQRGDVLILKEWDVVGGYTGRYATAGVGYVMYGGQFGVEEGYCILGLTGVQRFPHD